MMILSKPGGYILLFGNTVSYVWVYTLLVDPRTMGVATMLSANLLELTSIQTATLILIAAVLQTIGVLLPHRHLGWLHIPQALVFILAAAGAWVYVETGQYTNQPSGFNNTILADQVTSILLGLCHTAATVSFIKVNVFITDNIWRIICL